MSYGNTWHTQGEASEGCVLAAENGEYAAIVALKCETDFVAKNADFVALTKEILNIAMDKKPASKEELLALTLADGRSIQDHITDRSGITGEKMELGAFESVSGASTISYIHPGNKLATVVAFNQATIEHQMARDVAMQVAAMNPVAVRPDEVPQHIIDQELEIAKDKARQAGKPENLLDRIAQGSLQKYYKENTLLQQEFILRNGSANIHILRIKAERGRRKFVSPFFRRFKSNPHFQV